jgi:hypothetical protein
MLDLAAERFDARVLGALDPLRPIPGIELASRLAVGRLALEGQDIGGLQVALDRDGASATLRQLRLTGRRGEEVMLSGTASGDTMQLTAKLDAERLGDIARLAAAILPGEASEAFAQRAEALQPAIAVANFRIATKGGDAVWDVAVDGKLGGTSIVGKSHSALKGSDLAVVLEAELSNPDSARLVAQITGVKPESATIPGRITIKAEGNPRRTITGTLQGSLAGVDVAFNGGLSLFRNQPVEGAFTLSSKDLSGVARALGEAGFMFRDGQTGEVRGKVLADRDKITLTALDARFGSDPVSGEIAFDLSRGGQIAGQLRLGRINMGSFFAPVVGRTWPDSRTEWSRDGFLPAIPSLLAGDVWIEAREAVLMDGSVLSSPQFVFRVASGLVALEGFEAQLGETRIRAALSASRRAERVEIGGKLDVARLPLGLLPGRIALEIPFSAGGASPQELVASLAGAGRISVDDFRVNAADPAALAGIVAVSLDDLAPITENHIGGLIAQEMNKGDFRFGGVNWPASLVGGQMRVSGATLATAPMHRGVKVVPAFLVDFVRREAEIRLTYSQPELPKDWRGAIPEIALVLSARLDQQGKLDPQGKKEPVIQRQLQVASLVNGLLAMSIQRELERAEAFEADIRERESHLRRQRGDAYIERRAREIREVEEAIEREANQLKARQAAAIEFERQRELTLQLEREAKERAERELRELIEREARERSERLEKIAREREAAELLARTRAKLDDEAARSQPLPPVPAPASGAPLELAPQATTTPPG